MSKYKRATSPELKQNKPKTSKISPKNEKRTDIFSINSVVSIWCGQQDLNPRHMALESSTLPTELYP